MVDNGNMSDTNITGQDASSGSDTLAPSTPPAILTISGVSQTNDSGPRPVSSDTWVARSTDRVSSNRQTERMTATRAMFGRVILYPLLLMVYNG